MKINQVLKEETQQYVWAVMFDADGAGMFDEDDLTELCSVFPSEAVMNEALFHMFMAYLERNRLTELDIESLHDERLSTKRKPKPELTMKNMKKHAHWREFFDDVVIIKLKFYPHA